MWEKLFSGADLMQKGMSVAWTRDHVIRHNIANHETPGFKAGEIDFETRFMRALNDNDMRGVRTHEAHIQIGGRDPMSVEPIARQQRGLSMRMDGNNVDIEAENTRLAQNSLQYNTLLYKLNSELSRIRLAINEGR